ncbi:flagellar hook assembly protein FlgD [Dyella acidisoli]|uniref:Basal-body rod modification protein FlgD n=1 Tax=Dyella acidisoli TaxID=1867834 RepID=A0ABQ5XQ17_9GAMM|nr:flagellar hook capping FlgD N-terminal domain-containing protein [Dyella acidisoli]GLQ92646.1 hypothetical protein GCM10007901_15970 [Dyella acidisoli]
MATNPISAASAANAGAGALGLDMQSLLQIILTQLTYQDPLKPVDNFEFVSQLAQFTTLEQTRQLTDKIDSLLQVQSATQTLGLLGRTVDVTTNTSAVSGVVKSISFEGDQPELVIATPNGDFLTNATVSQIKQVR